VERTGKREKNRGWSKGVNTSSRKKKKKTFLLACQNLLKIRVNFKFSLEISTKQMTAFQCLSLTGIPW